MAKLESFVPYGRNKVAFKSRGEEIIDCLYSPTGLKNKHAAVVIIGPFASIKEQTPKQYATRLVREGFVVLIFDPSYHPWTAEKCLKSSRWENRYSTMSDADLRTFNAYDHASKGKILALIVQGEMSDGGTEAAQHFFARLASKKETTLISPDRFHTLFDEHLDVINLASQQVALRFKAESESSAA
jgi:hypothetical protein